MLELCVPWSTLSGAFVNKETQEVETRWFFPSIRVIGKIALREHSTGVINIERYGLMTIIL